MKVQVSNLAEKQLLKDADMGVTLLETLSHSQDFNMANAKRVADSISKLSTAIELTEGLSLPLLKEIDETVEDVDQASNTETQVKASLVSYYLE